MGTTFFYFYLNHFQIVDLLICQMPPMSSLNIFFGHARKNNSVQFDNFVPQRLKYLSDNPVSARMNLYPHFGFRLSLYKSDIIDKNFFPFY